MLIDFLLAKLDRVAAALARDLGTLEFFALLHRVDTPDSWDLVVSSSALPEQKKDAVDCVANYVEKSLTPSEMVHLARIVTLPPGSSIVRELLEDESVKLNRMFIPLNRRFDRAYILFPKTNSLQSAGR